MSTVPEDAWRDAGLESPEDTTSLVEEAADADDAEEYHPRHARADLDDRAAEADVVEQSQEVPGLDEPDAVQDA